MADLPSIEESIFLEAIELAEGAERSEYLRKACGGDTQLLAEITALLAAHEVDGDLLELPDRTGDARTMADLAPGTWIGNYRLGEQVGRGGMGVVYAAEQVQPLRRQVAVKIIKPGMDSEEVLCRFEAERLALALMEHPHIARVLDAGTCDAGRPYFVMELVRGIPITDYCRQHALTIQQRLALFVTVCGAVQHAHQKGVIHRDLKPTNVLITSQEDSAVAKVIDFGVAKATDRRLADHSLTTCGQQMLGTPMYMSPEQAELGGLDVDTRSDIYSLGVLLYELLTGSTPFEPQRLAEASLDEVRRMIREQDPPRPSTLLRGRDAGRPRGARLRPSAARAVAISADLDWIVMKAMDKDRTRRYETASSLADDLTRHMTGEMVEARPPSLGYRLAKYCGRNRALVTGTACVAAALLVGLSFALHAYRETAALNSQLHTTLSQLTETLYDQGMANALSGESRRAEETARQLQALGDAQSALQLRAFSLIVTEQWEDAVANLEPAVQQNSQSAALVALLGSAYGGSGDLEKWFAHNQRLRSLTPKSDSDRLLQAIAISPLDPSRAKTILDDVVRSRRSPVALLIRARTLAAYAEHTGQDELLQASLEDVAKARAWLGTDGIAGWMILETYVRAGKSAAPGGWRPGSGQFREDLGTVVAALELRPAPSVWESIWLGKFQYQCGERQRALQRYARSARETGSDLALQHYLCLAHELGLTPPEEIVRLISPRGPGPYSELAWAFVQAAGGRREEAAERARGAIETYDSLDSALTGLLLLHFVGDFSAAQRIAHRLEQRWRHENLDPWNAWLRDHALQYYLTELDQAAADRLLAQAESSEYQRRWLAIAHSQLAATRVGQGRPDAAERHMRRCVDQQLLDTFDVAWWRGVLARRDANIVGAGR